MKTKTLRHGIAICAAVLLLAGCTVYQQPYPVAAAPAPQPYYGGGYYAPPAYAYAPPVYAPAYVGPSIGLGFGFGFGDHDRGHRHHWR